MTRFKHNNFGTCQFRDHQPNPSSLFVCDLFTLGAPFVVVWTPIQGEWNSKVKRIDHAAVSMKCVIILLAISSPLPRVLSCPCGLLHYRDIFHLLSWDTFPQDNGLEEPNKKHTTYTYNIMYDHLIGECRANRKIVIKALNGHFAHSFLSRTNAGCYW